MLRLRCWEEGEQTVEEQNETHRPMASPEKGTKPDARVIGLPGGRLSDAGLRDAKGTDGREQ
jgi:hypothetical protein